MENKNLFFDEVIIGLVTGIIIPVILISYNYNMVLSFIWAYATLEIFGMFSKSSEDSSDDFEDFERELETISKEEIRKYKMILIVTSAMISVAFATIPLLIIKCYYI